ncbi:protein DDI1 homolog 2-like [Haliotis asinina]|uniref:protein DDI1 homolog 2-like n=1 Tax=Haliotis asinina TaxID=109174 RepID=UPI0035325E08
MQLTITSLSDDIFTLDVSEDLELENFKALCEFETGISSNEIAILWNGRPLQDDKQTLKQYGIKNGDVLLLQQLRSGQRAGGQAASGQSSAGAGALPQIDFGSIHIPGAGPAAAPRPIQPQNPTAAMMEDPDFIRQMLLSNPHQVALLKERNQPLAEALASGKPEKFREVFLKQQKERQEKEKERIRLATADPFDADAQRQIAEEIRLKNVESNMETAMEFAPESFGQVVMLYVDCMVNGHAVKAFVDSGAQMTIMSQACAERCNIMRLVDKRWAGIAKGVGTQRIIGRVHLCQIQIGPDYLQSSFSILEDQPMDMLLGLDMLKRHQCCIDLKKNRLIIGTTGTETHFLAEGDLPEHARLNLSNQPSVDKEDEQLAQALAKSAAEAASGSKPTPSTSGTKDSKSGSSSAAPAQSLPSFPEEVVQRLMSRGFTRHAVLEELRLAGGHVDTALAALIAKSFSLP